MSDATTLRVLVVANKSWEAEPLVGMLAGKRPRPRRVSLCGEPAFPTPVPDAAIHPPAGDDPGSANCLGQPRPRLRLRCDGMKPPSPRRDGDGNWITTWIPTCMDAEVWCIEDWMTHAKFVSTSSSYDKWRRALPAIRDGALAAVGKRGHSAFSVPVLAGRTYHLARSALTTAHTGQQAEK